MKKEQVHLISLTFDSLKYRTSFITESFFFIIRFFL